MILKDVMTPGVEVITPKATLQQAAAKMCRLNIGPLPVCDGDQLIEEACKEVAFAAGYFHRFAEEARRVS